MTARLIVTVDTEEDGAWDAGFKAHGNTVDNIRGVRRFQDLCDEHSVKPTYLVDTPVVEDDQSVDILGGIAGEGRCEIGAHLHPWCAPPLSETTNGRESFMCNLPRDVQQEKLARLTDSIEARFGSRPTSFRAGRYGLDIVGAKILEELGFKVDSSVVCFTDYSEQGGPDFRRAPITPFYIGGNDLCTPAASGRLLEVPVSVGYNRVNFPRAHRVREWASGRYVRPFRLVGILDRLGVVGRIKFSPEQSCAGRMRRLVDTFVANSAPCIVMMLHSASLVPGRSPYARDQQQLDRLFGDMATTFKYCQSQHGLASDTLTAFAENYSAQAGEPLSKSIENTAQAS